MCDSNCLDWISKNVTREEIYGKRVIEVGSLDVNGSPRSIIERFDPLEYVGVDIIRGKGVDLICSCEDLITKFGDNIFDIVISTCTLEHVRDWRTSISNIKRICKPNGIILIIVPAKWPKHDFPYDFWRFSKNKLYKIFLDCDIIKLDSDFRIGSDGSGDIFSFILVYLKCRKPENFSEEDLKWLEIDEVK